jgi:hypothetical protein
MWQKILSINDILPGQILDVSMIFFFYYASVACCISVLDMNILD